MTEAQRFGSRLRTARHHKKLSQKELANKIKKDLQLTSVLGKDSICKYECGAEY